MLVIRLARTGAKNRPCYRLTVADSRFPVRGRFIERIGYYDPLSPEKKAVINKTQYEAWIKKGAQPTKRVKSLFSKIQ